MLSSEYINSERKEYSLYVLGNRAIPHVADGMKAGARRVMWVARDGKKHKSATLAGAAIPLHPHAPPESTINTLAAPYGNNVPLLAGQGAFGTLLNPAAYGASRYTSVAISNFAKDVVFKDIEIVPMIDNFDSTLMEPKHFLPLIPLVLVNPQSGIAVGFACDILARDLKTIVSDQIAYLESGTMPKPLAPPVFLPTYQKAVNHTVDANGNVKWIFHGSFEKVNASSVRITGLPYGMSHDKITKKLETLSEGGLVTEFVDNSKDKFNIAVKFKRGTLTNRDDDGIKSLMGLITTSTENLNVIDFDGTRVWSTSYQDIIVDFSEWRLSWYVARFKRLVDLIEVDIQKLKDILLAIKKNVGGLSRKIKNRAELKEYLDAIGIVNLDYIADLGVYRFTEDERVKTEQKLSKALATLDHYNAVLASGQMRKDIYVEELKEIKSNIKQYA